MRPSGAPNPKPEFYQPDNGSANDTDEKPKTMKIMENMGSLEVCTVE